MAQRLKCCVAMDNTQTLDLAALERVLGGQGIASPQRTSKIGGGGGGGGPARGLGEVFGPIIEEAASSPEFREPAHAPYRTP